MCCVCECYERGHSGDGCDLFKYDLGNCDLSELGKGVMSEAAKYLFRAANVWWRCAQYCIIASCG